MAVRSGIRPLNAFYLELQRQLSSSDVTKIKDQLLNGQIDRADYEGLKTATQIFQYLEDRGCISTENLTLLSELFLRIRLPHLADQVGEFLENPLSPTLPLRSPLLSPTQRLPSTPLPSPSLVQSSPLQRSPPLPVSQQQQLLPFFEGSVGEKRPQQDYGDQQVAKRLTREHAQEHGALKAAESMIPQPHFVKGKQSMLFVNSDWSNEMHRISILSRLLADVLESEAVDRYATTLEVSDIGFTVDKSGVTVINALESKVDILQNKMPTLDWLINYPNAIYDHMQGIENIRLVVGHMSTGSDEHLHQAGLAVHENMKKSKFFLFNHSIPEGMSVVTPDVEVAAKAEVVFSVGPTVYSHFQTQYHVPPSPKCHICFYPPTSAQLMGLKVKVPSTTGMQRILTFCEVKTTEDFKKYNEIAIAMGKVAEKFHGTKQSVPIRDVMVSTKDLAGKFREHLRKASGSPQLQLYTIPSPSNQSLVVKLQQSVLLVVPEKRDPFNYVAYFAMQAGLPVVVAKRSGMGEFLVELCPLICDAYMVDAGVHDFSTSDADNWRQKIIDNLKNQELSFERAKQVKEALANNDLIRNSTRTFVEYCRSAFQGKDNHAESNQGGDIQAVLPSSDDGEVDGDRRNDSDDSEGVQIHFRSTVWQEKLEKLMAMTDDQHIQHLGDVKLCMTDEFLIARGGHLTEVYVGIDLKKEVEVAVKRIDPKGASIENEVAVMKRVNGLSMNIVELYDHIQPNTIYDRSQYLVMELCEKTLESYIQELSSGSDEETRQIAYRDVIIDFLSGLRTLHKMKIVHRDLKPRNILIDCRGRAKLSDFGISRLLADQTRIHTKKTTAAGTECWESWETVAPLIEGRGEAMYSDKSDIQVAGMLVFYTLTGGIHPYGDMKATIGIAMNIKDEKAINMDKLKDCVARHLVEWMIRKDRKRRPEIDAVLRHAFFWPNEKRFGFLVAVASVLASGQAHILQSEINTSGEKMNIVNWVDKVRTGPYSSIVKDATIGPKAVELLKFMKTCYYADTSVPKHNTTNAAATETPAAYFLETFPDVFLTVYDVIHQSRYSTGTNWTKDEALLQFFSRDEF